MERLQELFTRDVMPRGRDICEHGSQRCKCYICGEIALEDHAQAMQDAWPAILAELQAARDYKVHFEACERHRLELLAELSAARKPVAEWCK